jgi:hypothetical protein
MKNEEEKHVSQGSGVEIAITRVLFLLPMLVIPLLVGRLFGIVPERFAYGLVILFLSLRYTEVCIVLDGITVMIETAQKEMEKKRDERR